MEQKKVITLISATMVSAPVSAFCSTFFKKFPVILLKLGSSERIKVGMPTAHMLMMDSWIGING